MSLNIPQQSSFFYQSDWTPEIDAMFLSTIIRMKKALNWKGVVIPSHFLLEAQVTIEEGIGCRFTWDELYERLQTLEHRYRTFKEVVDVPGTYWDVHTNNIIAPEKVWKDIFKINPFAQAYYYRGEPEFPNLAILFGGDHIKTESENKVIVISDTSIPMDDQEDNTRLPATASDEVTSPMGNEATKLRRKLFDDQPQPLDLESTNEKGHYFYVIGPDGEMKCKLQNVYPPQAGENVTKAHASSCASSCGSSSPSKWWKNPFK